MKILAKLSPSNKLQIKRYRVAEGYLRKKVVGDSQEVRERDRVGRAFDSIFSSRKVLTANSPVIQPAITASRTNVRQICLFGEQPPPFVEPLHRGEYCDIPVVVEYAGVDQDGVARVRREDYKDFSGQYRRTLDILKKTQQKKKKHSNWGARQREKVFRWQGAEKIKEGGAVIDRFVGKYNSSMLTLTLPGGTEKAKAAIADWSGWIINLLMQVVRRVPKSYPPVHWFFVWEHQKRGALHLHMCLAWKVAPEIRKELGMRIKDKWFQCLLRLQKKSGVDCFQPLGFRKSYRDKPFIWQWDYQEIVKSVAGYFSKYCQKNSELNGQTGEVREKNKKNEKQKAPSKETKRPKYYPSRYWGSSRSIKNWVKRLAITLTVETYSEQETELIYQRLVIASMHNQEVDDITETEFQVIDERNGCCISSGDITTFRIPSEQYPLFWARVVRDVFDRDICMDAMMEEFLGTELFASMQRDYYYPLHDGAVTASS